MEANEVVMPRLGWTMEVGRVVEWLKRDGEAVATGEPIFSVESDKAVSEVEALDSGVLRIPPDSPPPGAEVPVGGRLAYIVPVGAPAPFERSDDSGDGRAAEDGASAGMAPRTLRPVAPGPGPAGNGRVRDGRPAISPRARRAAAALGLDWAVLSGSGGTGRIVERDVRLAASAAAAPSAASVAPPGPRAAPAVRRLAEEGGVDLGRLPASGPAGRVTRADVRAAVGLAAPLPETLRPAALARERGAPVGPIRRIVGERMAESARTVAPVTLTTEADATELVRVRGHLKAELAATGEPVPSFGDLLVRLAALALVEHPDLNASLDGDRIVVHDAIHVGVAVETERGLLVPVVRDAQRKGAREIAAETARLIERARAGASGPDDLRGGTFTVTNLGMYDVDAFTPIVTLPQCAVLGLGRIVPRPVVVDEATEEVAVRRMLTLSLTFDHRLTDGAPAARFLRRVKQLVERPYAALMR